MPKAQKVAKTSSDIPSDNLAKLRAVFPQFVKDGEIDFDAFQAFLKKDGHLAGPEKYGLNWAGKSDAFQAIRIPATGTLVPDKGRSENWDKTGNLFLEGDNLEVLKLLQKHYREQVKMIYIDPPYNTGKDFIYTDNFTENKSDYYERTGQSKNGIKMTTNLESNGRYHSDWLTMMYPRLFLARNLLKDDGVIFVSIDDNEVHNLRMVMDEIFGEDNFIAEVIWEKRFTRSNNAMLFANLTDKILLYRKTDILMTLRDVRSAKTEAIYSNPDSDSRGQWTSVSYVNPATKAQRPNLSYAIIDPKTGKKVLHPTNAWKFSQEVHESHVKENRLYWGQKGENTYPRLKRFLSEMGDGVVPVDLWSYEEAGTTDQASKDLETLLGGKYFDFPKPVELIEKMIKITTLPQNNDIILDFFAGSGTAAQAVIDLNADGGNRKFICVQIPEETDEKSEARKAGYKTISDIAIERIRRAGKEVKKGHVQAQGAHVASDVGFRTYRLAASNYRQWNVLTEKDSQQELLKQAKLFADKPLVNAFDPESVVYEVALKEGFDLQAEVKEDKKTGLWIVQDGEKRIVVSFAKKLTQKEIEAFKLEEHDVFVCFDSALDDTTKVNISRGLEVRVI